jgi:hypothetical protein
MPAKIQRTLAMTARAACVTIVTFISSSGHAAEVRVLSAAAMQSVFKDPRRTPTHVWIQTSPPLRHGRRRK